MILYFDIETASTEEDKTNLNELTEKHGELLPFMPEYNFIITITCGVKTTNGDYKIENLQGDEKTQINKFFEIINGNNITLVGHNIKNFDLPFIVKRALHYGITIPEKLKVFGKKPRELDYIIDLYEIYKYLSYGNVKGSLDLICGFIGIPTPKDGISGGEVQEYYSNGKVDIILEYCKKDVLATMKVHERFKELNLV